MSPMSFQFYLAYYITHRHTLSHGKGYYNIICCYTGSLTDVGDHWVPADWNENQLPIYDSARQKKPAIIGPKLDKLKNLVPGER